ncbi:hypothetical protein [Paenarthrobacter nitroguajacolicus]|uniref:hypothetical protein n=1 Tax=Paenarthrobacter nitroguajacolicus TaxID=211146 RepID=UPI00248AFBC5|nr:hypothetical protein [Paenarthrobacter nitroguajacolicus]
MTVFVLTFFVFITCVLTTQTDIFSALLLTRIWFAVLGIAYAVIRKSPGHQARVAKWNAVITTQPDSEGDSELSSA